MHPLLTPPPIPIPTSPNEPTPVASPRQDDDKLFSDKDIEQRSEFLENGQTASNILFQTQSLTGDYTNDEKGPFEARVSENPALSPEQPIA